MITKELIEQLWAESAPILTYDEFEVIAQRAVAYGAEQRELELMAVGMEPVKAVAVKVSHVGSTHMTPSGDYYTATQLEAVRLLGAQEEHKRLKMEYGDISKWLDDHGDYYISSVRVEIEEMIGLSRGQSAQATIPHITGKLDEQVSTS